MGVDKARHMGDILAGFGCVSQGTAQEVPLQPPKMHVDQKMGRRLVVAGVRWQGCGGDRVQRTFIEGEGGVGACGILTL